jgi:chromosome segregation ATPase
MLGAEGWMVIGVGVVAGVLVLAQSWRKATGRVAQLEIEATRMAAKAEKLAVDLSKEARARRRQSEELASLRKRAEKTKRRKMKSADQPLGTSQRIRDHEAEVERVGLERDRVNSEREALEKTVADLESRLAESARALALATAREPEPEPEPVATALDESPGELASALEREKKLEGELQLAGQSELRMRKRMSNQEMLYASLRAELDVKKDRLRTQEEQLQRLQALKVAVID